MRHKLYAIILFIGIIVFGGYNIGAQSCAPIATSNIISNRRQIDLSEKNNYKEIIKENQSLFKENVYVLKASKDWFDETLELLNEDDLESIMFLYSKGSEQDISTLIYNISLHSGSRYEKKAKELELNWDRFCDNFEFAYFNKSQGAEYKKYIDKARDSISKIIEVIDSMKLKEGI